MPIYEGHLESSDNSGGKSISGLPVKNDYFKPSKYFPWNSTHFSTNQSEIAFLKASFRYTIYTLIKCTSNATLGLEPKASQVFLNVLV